MSLQEHLSKPAAVQYQPERRVFIVDGKPYVGAGVLFYTEDLYGKIHLLMQKVSGKNWIWADLGGHSEPEDKCIENVAFRSCQQTLNFKGDITIDYLTDLVKNKKSTIYRIHEHKHMLYVINIPYSFKETLDVGIFGKAEESNNNSRLVRWISYHDISKTLDEDIHPRLKPDDFKINLPLIIAKGMSQGDNLFF